MRSVWGTWRREVTGRMGKVGRNKTRASASAKTAKSTECGPTVSSEQVVRHQLISESAPFLSSRRAALSDLLSLRCASHRRRAQEFARSTVCNTFPCLFLFFFEKLVYGRFSLFSVATEPDLTSKHCLFATHSRVVTNWHSCHELAHDGYVRREAALGKPAGSSLVVEAAALRGRATKGVVLDRPPASSPVVDEAVLGGRARVEGTGRTNGITRCQGGAGPGALTAL